MAIWTREPGGCDSNPGCWDVGGRIRTYYVSRDVPGVTRVETSGYPYRIKGSTVAYIDSWTREPLTAGQARERIVGYGSGGAATTTLDHEEWLVGSGRAILESWHRVWIPELGREDCERLLSEVAEVRRVRLARCRLARTYPEAAGGYGVWQDGDPPRADAGIRTVGYDADGDPVAIFTAGETLEHVRARLRDRLAALQRQDRFSRQTAAREQDHADRLRPLYDRARERTAGDARQSRLAEHAYTSACRGYDHDRRHWEQVLGRLAGWRTHAAE